MAVTREHLSIIETLKCIMLDARNLEKLVIPDRHEGRIEEFSYNILNTRFPLCLSVCQAMKVPFVQRAKKAPTLRAVLVLYKQPRH